MSVLPQLTQQLYLRIPDLHQLHLLAAEELHSLPHIIGGAIRAQVR